MLFGTNEKQQLGQKEIVGSPSGGLLYEKEQWDICIVFGTDLSSQFMGFHVQMSVCKHVCADRKSVV